MFTLKKAALTVALVISVCFLGIGYAAITRTISVSGSSEYTAPVYDTLVITSVTTVEGKTVDSETHYHVAPTNVMTVLSASAGKTVTYKITAHNYSEEFTYIYMGTVADAEFYETANKVSISASADSIGGSPMPNNPSANYSTGTPVAPGEDFEFYATYTVRESVSSGELMVNYLFKPVAYTVTYLDNNEIYAADYIVDNSKEYTVRNDYPQGNQLSFAGWMNASAVVVESYPAGNNNDYTLTAKWDNTYVIIFVDEHGEVIYQESFTDTSKKNGLSAEGQAIVDAKLAELAVIAQEEDLTVDWSDYDIKNATSDITVRPVYTYTGNLRLTPIDEDSDGYIDYYRVDAVASLDEVTKIPGKVNGLPVKVINKVYANSGNLDYSSGVKVIEVGEGTVTINANALAYTSSLTTVKLPSTIEYLGKNTFSRNWGDDKKVLTIEFNGTKAEWQAIVNNSHDEWHNGLQEGSVVKCSDGYFELDRTGLFGTGYTWREKNY